MRSGAGFDEWRLLHALRDRPEIFAQLEELAGSELHRQKELRRDFSDDLVRGALTQHDLRKAARVKFARAEAMWFDPVGLEQATAEPIARHKAARFSGRVRDECCGIGGDALALASRCEVVAVDIDPAACLRTRWNAEAYGVNDSVHPLCADVETLPGGDEGALLHIDPDRRAASGSRTRRVEQYRPSLDFLRERMRRFAGGAIKLSPAANFAGKFAGTEIELISLDGECKEACVWFGSLAGDAIRRATALPSGETLAGDPLDAVAEVGDLGSHLYDPDPAVVRAGLVDLLAETHGLRRLDVEEEYLTGDGPADTSLARGFAVLAELPNNERAIRDHFRRHPAGDVEIKCRHIPVAIERIRRKLPLEGTGRATLIFARVAGRARAVVCRRLD
ncbi:MAG: hypothetical protein WD066_11805 [Planctomycetaceae bacterium]